MPLSARACSFALAMPSAFKFLIVFPHWSTHGQNYLTSTCFFFLLKDDLLFSVQPHIYLISVLLWERSQKILEKRILPTVLGIAACLRLSPQGYILMPWSWLDS